MPTLPLIRLLLHTKCFLGLCTFSLIYSARGYFLTLYLPTSTCTTPITYSHISLLHVRRTKERERMLEYVTIELQKWHPTPRRNVNRSDYYDVAPLDTIWPDPPLNVAGILRVRLTSLV